jgi:exodeoxyribonuclease VII large subunit
VAIADLVADVRAPTPTAAAELAVPVLDELLEALAGTESSLRRLARHHLELARSRWDAMLRAELFRDPLGHVHRAEQQLDETSSRLQLSWSQRLARVRQRLHQSEIILTRLQPVAFVREQRGRLLDMGHRLRWAMEQRSRSAERRSARVWQALVANSPGWRLPTECERVRQQCRHLGRAAAHRVLVARHSIEALEARLEATSYRHTLARGFSITRFAEDRRIITHPDQVHAGQRMVTETAGGEIESVASKRDKERDRSHPRPSNGGG